ncbi:DUF4333 domain-containing protein [Streptomyces curacoi]|uniref:DUF4333 domain-containing protein n=1 Tax=Streptomyces curacoi TaxID=146536 RepID=A0A117PAZ5_9ACTN|nr:DUF4333 domain-containing protein [Streptomyces curacoi]KUM76243.1 hypothetical protein AQI70_14890 [Streptomyces curacoi]
MRRAAGRAVRADGQVRCWGGCSVEAKLSKDEVANTVAEKLAAQTGQPKPDVTCPEDLVGKVGTSLRCKRSASDGTSLGVTVRVTSVDGNAIKYDIKADETVS